MGSNFLAQTYKKRNIKQSKSTNSNYICAWIYGILEKAKKKKGLGNIAKPQAIYRGNNNVKFITYITYMFWDHRTHP